MTSTLAANTMAGFDPGTADDDPTQLAIPWTAPTRMTALERRERHLDAVRAAQAMPDAAGLAKARAIASIKAELLAFIRGQPVGTRFQAMAFRARLHERGVPIAPADPRCLGGLFAQLRAARVLGLVGLEPTGGYRPTNNNSCPRAVWRVLSHDTDALAWETAA